MERKHELGEYIKEYRDKRKGKKMGEAAIYTKQLLPSFLNSLCVLIKEQEERQQKGQGEKIKFMFLCRLMSSYYTESYDVMLGLSSVKLYLDERKSQVFWKTLEIYEGIEKDMEEARKILSRKFIRLKKSELFYIKKELLGDDWEVLQQCFEMLSRQVAWEIAGSSLDMEEEVLFLSGNYMDHMRIVGRLETGKTKIRG